MNSRFLTVLSLPLAMITTGCGITINAVETVSDTVQTITNITSSGFNDSDSDRTAAAFIENNFDNLSAQAARGGGEAVDSLAALLAESNTSEFSRWLQANYDYVFTDRELTLTRIRAGRPAVG